MLTIDISMLERFAFLHGCQAADAEDVACEAWLRMQTADFHGDSTLKTYAWSVVRNLCADRVRRQTRQPASSLEDEPTEPVSTAAPVFAEMESREMRQAVRCAVAGLTEPHRAVIEAHYFRCESLESIARLHGVAEGTVKSRLHRARESMVALLRGCC